MTVIPEGRAFLTKRPGTEEWVSQIAGEIWVEVTRDPVRQTRHSVKVPPYGVLRITTEDRELAQDLCLDHQLDPFTNGMLIRRDADQQQDPRTASEAALELEDLVAVFQLKDEEFKAKVDALAEVPIRRMLEIAEDADASARQIAYLKETIDRRWPISSGDTASNRFARAERDND